MTTNTNLNNSPQREDPGRNQQGKFTLPVFDFIFGLLDRLFKDGATGKVLASRVATLVIIFLMALIWVKSDTIAQIYKESTYESYAHALQVERNKRFDLTIQEQIQSVHVATGSDFSGVYVFRPKNLNYFVDLEVYEGKIPESVDPKNLGGFPVDKTSNEYMAHLAGRSFDSETEFAYLPSTEDNKGLAYMYSCPYFNLDNIYSGSVAMYWYGKPHITKKRLESICNQAARAIGRTR